MSRFRRLKRCHGYDWNFFTGMVFFRSTGDHLSVWRVIIADHLGHGVLCGVCAVIVAFMECGSIGAREAC